MHFKSYVLITTLQYFMIHKVFFSLSFTVKSGESLLLYWRTFVVNLKYIYSWNHHVNGSIIAKSLYEVFLLS